VLSRQIEKHPDHARTDTLPLHRRHYVDGAQENRVAIRPPLNPIHFCPIGRYDADIVGLEAPGKTRFLLSLIPSEETLNRPSHGFKVELTGEIEVLRMVTPKADIHERKGYRNRVQDLKPKFDAQFSIGFSSM
jgi:hypothetical protein